MTFFKNVVKKKIVINIIKLFSTNSFSFIFAVFPLDNLYLPYSYLSKYLKSSRCPKLDVYGIGKVGGRVEREVVKMMHYGWSSGEMEWSSGVV